MGSPNVGFQGTLYRSLNLFQYKSHLIIHRDTGCQGCTAKWCFALALGFSPQILWRICHLLLNHLLESAIRTMQLVGNTLQQRFQMSLEGRCHLTLIQRLKHILRGHVVDGFHCCREAIRSGIFLRVLGFSH